MVFYGRSVCFLLKDKQGKRCFYGQWEISVLRISGMRSVVESVYLRGKRPFALASNVQHREREQLPLPKL